MEPQLPHNPLTQPAFLREDQEEITLRPKRIDDYIGQENIKRNLDVFMQAAQKRNEPLEHVLLSGPSGLGKTTLANIIANEMGGNIKITSGPALERSGDLAAILTNLQPGDIFFIDEIHRLKKNIEETLYSAMEDFALDIIIGKGPTAKTLRIDLPKFTLIGATTKIGMISAPLRNRFGNVFQFTFYTHDDMAKIVSRNAQILSIKTEPNAITHIANVSRRTPRIANRILKRVRDYCDVHGNGELLEEDTKAAIEMLGIDHIGLDTIDKMILETIIHKFKGGPVGLNTISASTAQEEHTLEEVYEPFLIQLGFIDRTPRGRIATHAAYEHMGLTPPSIH